MTKVTSVRTDFNQLYPGDDVGGLLLFKDFKKVDYVTYNDGIHNIEIHDIATQDMSGIIAIFEIRNS